MNVITLATAASVIAMISVQSCTRLSCFSSIAMIAVMYVLTTNALSDSNLFATMNDTTKLTSMNPFPKIPPLAMCIAWNKPTGSVMFVRGVKFAGILEVHLEYYC